MTPNEIQMLITGIALGVVLMNLLHAWWNSQAARKQQTEAEAALKRTAGDVYLSSLRLYRLQNRQQKFPITTHAYVGDGFDTPCTAAGYGTACGVSGYDHAEGT